MFFLITVIASFSLLFQALATAAPSQIPNGGFTLKQTVIKGAGIHHGPSAYARALRKYNATVPSALAAAATATGTAVNRPGDSADDLYVVSAAVGGSQLNLDIDTGSSDLWVFSEETPASQAAGHNVYKPSPDAQKLQGYTWEVLYGDFSNAHGDVYLDKVTIGDITYKQQAVEAAQQVSAEFVNITSLDGLMGLAFSNLNQVKPKPQKTFFDNIKESLAEPLFAVVLKHQAPGEYDFGFISPDRYTGDITYTPVIYPSLLGYWSFGVTGTIIGSGQTSSGPFYGIADTGTTLLLLDQSIVSTYYSGVEGAQETDTGYVFPCDAKLPDFTVLIGSHKARVAGELINYAPNDSSGKTCFGGIQSNAQVGLSIFGDIFLKSQYVVFDSEGPRLGFAQQA